ncbi:hypothetical protein [Cellulomonas composti]|uniref:Thioredoxin-like fold domain-containing protein n=1 Tax=Cellulomonas composti TaxID=266130 RepID=A0A511J8U3_9CELL|nr:hypothetical protein [Cellulomonas composti]GEL94414.1 hypothetical protein CCO02nite_10720 [Cellulomonas composti]
MSYAKSARSKTAYKQRRASDKELAAIERARRVRRARLRRFGLRAGAVVGCVAVVGAIVVGVQSRARAAGTGPANMASDGIVLLGTESSTYAVHNDALAPGDEPVPSGASAADGVLPIVMYVDYRDPQGAAFWTASSADIAGMLADGSATLEVHPLALLDGAEVAQPAPVADADPTSDPTTDPTADPTTDPTSGATTYTATGDYSARAAGALGCVANFDPDQALLVHSALEQAVDTLPADGLDDDALAALVADAGVTSDDVADCIQGHDYTDWAAQVTDRAATSVPFDIGSVTTSPVVLVDGQPYTGGLGDADAFQSFVTQVFTSLDGTDLGTTDPTTDPTTEPSTEPTTEPTIEPSADATE